MQNESNNIMHMSSNELFLRGESQQSSKYLPAIGLSQASNFNIASTNNFNQPDGGPARSSHQAGFML